MEQIIQKFETQAISPCVDIDKMCNQLSNAGIEYDERSELYDFLELKMAGKSELVKTDERYARYLRGIDIWEIDGVSYEYIKENIKMFLSIETNDKNLVKKLKLMRKIDKQINEIIQTSDGM